MIEETIEAMLKSHKDLEGAILNNYNFRRAKLRGIKLRGASLINADLFGADLFRADLTKANLINANLGYANLLEAELANASLAFVNLTNAIGNGKQIKTVQLDYIINYTADRLQIGCKNYSFDEWLHFRNSKIASMDYKALEFWKKNKKAIFKIIETSPAIK